jgi:hypothetical protein
MDGEAVVQPAHATKAAFTEATFMLAEKFFLLLETRKSRSYPDGSPRVVSTSPHVPVQLPRAK